MASVSPLYVDDNNDLVEMTSAEIVEVQQRAIYAYSQNVTAILTQVSGSGANITGMDYTRLQAVATSQSTSAFVAEGTTAEPGTVTVSFDKINLAYTTSGVNQTADTGTTFPVYYDSSTGSVQAMSLDDMKDTFLHPAIDLMVVADTNNDKKITARELHSFVVDKVERQSQFRQTPELQGDKDRVLVQFN